MADMALNEWQVCRDLLQKFDDRLHDLRKYGFSFITALLAADSVLGQASGSSSIILVPQVKFAVMLATLVLIVGLRLIDKDYELYQKAAAHRAIQLEAHLQMGLTKTIAEKYEREKMWHYVSVLYAGFAFATGLLGCFVLLNSGILWLLGAMILVTAIAIGLIVSIGLRIHLKP